VSRGRRVPSGARRPSLCGRAAGGGGGWRGRRGPSLGWADMLRCACCAFCPRGRASARFALGDTARGRCRAGCRRARVSCGREARGGPAPCLPSAEPRLGGHVAVCVRRVLSAWPSLGAVRAGRRRSRPPRRGLSPGASLVWPGGAWRAGAVPPVCRASAGRACCGVRVARSVRVTEPRHGSRWATPLAGAAPRLVAGREPRAAGRRVAGAHRASRLPSLGWAGMLRCARGAFCPRGRGSARFALGDTARGGRAAACRSARTSRGRRPLPAATAPAAPPCSPARRAAPARGPSPPWRHRPRSASGGWRPRGARPRRRTGAPW